MSIIKKAPAILTREFRMEEPVSHLLDDYAQFIESSADHVLNSVIKKTLWRDQETTESGESSRGVRTTALRGADRKRRQSHDAAGPGVAAFRGQASSHLAEAEAGPTGHGHARFRRGRISHLVYSGVSRQVIRDWCGHSSDKMIDHYTKLLRQHHAPEMAKLKPLLDPS